MKTLKISLSLLIPAVCGIAVFTALWFITANYSGHCSDVYASNTHAGLLPILCVISFFVGFLPCLFYVSSLLFSPVVLSENEEAQAVEMLTAHAPGLLVGKVFTSIGANCQLRVKEIKNIFAGLQEDQFNYVLQTSLY